MPASLRDIPADASSPETDGELVVQATTARAALQEVTAKVGAQATIVEASKVRRGGIAGFFAREMVQLRVRPGDSDAASPTTTTTADGDSTLERLLADMSREADAAERSFADVLRRELVEPGHDTPAGPETGTATPAPPAAETVQPDPEPAGTVQPDPEPAVPTAAGVPDWSPANLERLGLPAALVDALRDVDPAADLACLQRLTEAVGTLCRPLPTGPALVAGPRADRLGAGLGLPVGRPGQEQPAAGPLAVRLRDGARGRDWLGWHRGSRWLHLVVGGSGSWALAFDEPEAVSWVGDEALADALRVAVDLDIPLGFGLASARGAEPREANALDVAVAIRGQLPRR